MSVRYEKSAKQEWNERTSLALAKVYNKPEFDSILKKILPKSEKFTCLEIGAIPGGFLAYFNKEFNYNITGIDFAKNKKVFDETMRINKINKYKFISKDINNYKNKIGFDVVTSFGFIEHFDDYEKIINKHIELIKDDGYLIISLPNFRNLQFLYRVVFDRKNLKIHNLDSMKINKLRKIIKKRNMQELYSGYLGGIEFWHETPLKSSIMNKARDKITNELNKHKNNVKNSFLYSPMILLVYKKELKND